MNELLLLLLPIAAASGWYAARASMRRGDEDRSSRHNPAYFQGLNYLLNEQPDKAIDVFLKMLEVDGETVETHLALGSLFRRRGEVDRAIRIHQNLIARSALGREQRAQALLELGQDYMRAGLFDRAESLFSELTESNFYCEQSLKNLQIIYQQEKDWEKCLNVVKALEKRTGQPMDAETAHYYCELAEAALQKSDQARATELVKKARAADRDSVRAAILQGKMHLARGDCEAVLESYRRVAEREPTYVAEILGTVIDCYHELGRPDELLGYLRTLYHKDRALPVMLTIADMLEEREGAESAARFVAEHLKTSPSLQGLDRLIALNLKDAGETSAQETLRILKGLLNDFLRKRPVYHCEHCGYTARKLHWNCPGCKTWGSMKPVQGLENELR